MNLITLHNKDQIFSMDLDKNEAVKYKCISLIR